MHALSSVLWNNAVILARIKPSTSKGSDDTAHSNKQRENLFIFRINFKPIKPHYLFEEISFHADRTIPMLLPQHHSMLEQLQCFRLQILHPTINFLTKYMANITLILYIREKHDRCKRLSRNRDFFITTRQKAEGSDERSLFMIGFP